MKHFKTVSRVTKLNYKSMYFVIRFLPTVNTVLTVKKDIKSLSKAIKLLESISHDSVPSLKEDLRELNVALNGFKKLLSEEVNELTNLHLFSETELEFINNLIDN